MSAKRVASIRRVRHASLDTMVNLGFGLFRAVNQLPTINHRRHTGRI